MTIDVSGMINEKLNAAFSNVSARMSDVSGRTGIDFSVYFQNYTQNYTKAASSVDSEAAAGEEASSGIGVAVGTDGAKTVVSGAVVSNAGTAASNAGTAVSGGGTVVSDRETAGEAESKGGVVSGSSSDTAGTAEKSQGAAYTTGTGWIDAIASEAAARYNINPALLRALIWAESGDNPNAVSGAGALGLMQLMPATAEGLGVSDPLDPEQNVDGGAKYLASLLSRYDGDIKMAIAAYNCGTAGLSRRGVNSLETSAQMQALPAQTRTLIARVTSHMEGNGIVA